MRKILITGGTVFVSRYIAEHFVNFIPEYTNEEKAEVYVLNRGTRRQVSGVHLICCDKNNIGDRLRNYHFDVVIAVNTYTKDEMKNLLDALNTVKDFIFISSSAVYPETLPQPFKEEQPCGENSIWGAYGINKLEAENYLLSQYPNAYILRPPYLYGSMNNVYREGFVFDCAVAERPFYMPTDGSMKLQFFHVEDLCRFIEIMYLVTEILPDRQILVNTLSRNAEFAEQNICHTLAVVDSRHFVDRLHSRRFDNSIFFDISKQRNFLLHSQRHVTFQAAQQNVRTIPRKCLRKHTNSRKMRSAWGSMLCLMQRTRQHPPGRNCCRGRSSR